MKSGDGLRNDLHSWLTGILLRGVSAAGPLLDAMVLTELGEFLAHKFSCAIGLDGAHILELVELEIGQVIGSLASLALS